MGKKKEDLKIQDELFMVTDFDKQAVTDFFEFSKGLGHKYLYLTSLGGSGSAMVAMADIINKKPEEYTINVSGLNCSSAFLLCMYTTCKIEEIGSQYHIPVSHLWHSCQFEAKDWTKQEIKDMKDMDTQSFDVIKHVLTKKQINKRKRFVRYAGRLLFLRKYMQVDYYF
jgi:hypothetical protein